MKKVLLAFGIMLGMTSCLSNVELADEAKAKESQAQILSYFAKLNQNPIAIEDGSYYYVAKPNVAGEKASKGDTVKMHYVLSNLLTGEVLDSTKNPLVYQYGFLNPIYAKLLAYIKEGEQAVMALPGTSQSFVGLPAYTPLKVLVKDYVVRSQKDQIEEYIAKKKLTVTEQTANGLRYIRLNPGTGEIPASGKVVKLKYTGRFLNGFAFDGNMARTDSFSVTIGGSSTVVGFQTGVEKMRLGERAILVFPSTIGYGEKGSGSSIPGYTPLVFEIYVAKID
ncbi:FKBP-type peptidyl-prolyl cis-trans isomerase [Aquirufa regiilacus]|uniref:Peptidyl-prolyl cis-trans isomerase n=1 Tax=Aquirufa regiilacus TaxID=3024868 RepID=A0ABU3TTS3_9BACT|nr:MULTISPECIES: FKBP-type peptidyl-prolyl cis-trans isomerase [unclassified Aquirufa]MBP6054624.1 FKBP-type peptidyl-prolyl cis-trans isomerase [Cytophagaceae bacterium]MBP6093280.1 FKBP-type peptidyl-prolyl cis-trans isomerase [Cytophagaceae bacterium]MDT8887737.1 FKBP-type peptidyl-prolyl cis-trans isomerase [Aquirufa sp. LEPPI-3A]MDU0809052.1 FKBP-type peptidyl-prolyl cis-trans isomerase [Aquirufa sp. LEOWEIH-7C]